jgi:hypothetical protein
MILIKNIYTLTNGDLIILGLKRKDLKLKLKQQFAVFINNSFYKNIESCGIMSDNLVNIDEIFEPISLVFNDFHNINELPINEIVLIKLCK